MSIIALIFAIFLPPIGAFLQVGFSKQLIFNIILTLLGGIPGMIHAIWLVLTEHKG